MTIVTVILNSRIHTDYVIPNVTEKFLLIFCADFTPSFANKFIFNIFTATRIDLPKVSSILRLLLDAKKHSGGNFGNVTS